MSLSILSDDAIDSCHMQVFMKVVIANVPGGIHDTTEYSISEPLYDISVALAGTTPKVEYHKYTVIWQIHVLLRYLSLHNM
jgi:hypothetical protein